MRSSLRWIPDSADSTGYGTSTRSASDLPIGGASPALAPANSQTPLRFCQRSLVSCGRGYSGNALPGPTWLVHGVVSGGLPGFHAGCADAGTVVVLRLSNRAVSRTEVLNDTGDLPFVSRTALPAEMRTAQVGLDGHDDRQERAADDRLVVRRQRPDLVDHVLDHRQQQHSGQCSADRE